MAKSLYITPTETRSGKSLIVLGLMQLLLSDIRKVGFFRPIINVPETTDKDYDIDLVLSHFYLGLRYEETYAYTLEEAKHMVNAGKQSEMMETILRKYKQLEAKCGFVLCEGTDFAAGSEAFEFDINADIAADLGCPAMVVSNGCNKSVDEVVSSTQLSLESLEDKGVDILGVVVNRVDPIYLDGLKISLKEAIHVPDCLLYAIPEIDSLSRPTIRDVQKYFGAEVLYGKEAVDNQIADYIIAAMLAPNFLNHIKKDSLVVTPGDRSSIVLSSFASRYSSAYPDISGILVTGGIRLPDTIMRLIEGWKGVPVPILQVAEPTYPTIRALDRLDGRISAGNAKKISLALGSFETHVGTDELRQKLITRKSVRVTPQMFEYGLIEMAKRKRQHIVLPEGVGERILRASDILLRRGVCDLTLLGNEEKVTQKIETLGLNLSGANIVQPDKSALLEEYVETFYEMRKAKGLTFDRARDTMVDPTYFGTMMVQKGDADGMVSGSINTTAHTIRPGFQIIKTRPDSSIVSSVFLMCLKDRVLVFGDCAINPNPTAEQLAEIAIGSARTAQVFGVDPRVAMLSYSTGSSGTGADVEKVIQATNFAKEKAPELLLEGPIQYDAAIDPAVAKTKLPDSKVAGQATVFIFPDLNTGNNTYKAVQRASEKAVAIGPILQGLNKPVNDLSRGCTIPDIVNTVAITAIQAQAGKGLV
ncbi:MAG: phosphate acetyltransferase [Desulfobacteraceae bacterium]|nr:phosphate acetyltransferase [Desulfobacteraceae bacterium]